MTEKVITDLLTRYGNCTRDGQALTVADDTDLTVFVGLGTEPLIIERVVRIDLEEQVLVLSTARRERYAVAHEDVRSLRFGSREPSAGYR
jgi:hypothetical protein